ncbi:MAG: metallophosphoesterase [Acidobacteria bacterium]|nr:metallophosphoesterase [Acidobacteriota bacterium]
MIKGKVRMEFSTATELDTHWAWRPVRRTRLRCGRWWAARPGFPRVPEITDHKIFLKGLPPTFSAKVAQLSDLHHGLYVSLREIEQAVELVNYASPEMVLLTGDFVTRSWVHIEPVAEALGQLRAPLGLYAVMGNHDHRTGAEKIEKHLSRHGIEVLRNRHILVRHGQTVLGLAGMDDIWYTGNLRAALRGLPADIPRILLCHNPRIFLEAVGEGIDFVVSGHTHGGQVQVPGLGTMYRRKFHSGHSGLHRFQKTQIYVSRGIGKVVLPVRLGCPPEISIFHLKPSSGDESDSYASC